MAAERPAEKPLSTSRPAEKPKRKAPEREAPKSLHPIAAARLTNRRRTR